MTASTELATASSVRSCPVAVRCVLRIVLCAGILPCLSQCASKGYKAANYSDAKLATPPHNLSQRDYPFDASGNYRKDWVKNGSRTASGNNVNRPKTTTSNSSSSARVASTPPAPARTTVPTRSSSGSSSPPQRIATNTVRTTPPAAPTRTYTPPPAPKPKPAPKPAARYHTVQPKQTLWAISQKYGTTVAALKKTNGLRSDTIRIGQSLRIP